MGKDWERSGTSKLEDRPRETAHRLLFVWASREGKAMVGNGMGGVSGNRQGLARRKKAMDS